MITTTTMSLASFTALTVLTTGLSTMPKTQQLSQATQYAKHLGAVVLGGILQAFLLGFVLGQMVKYWYDYRDDSRAKRVFVTLIVILSIVQTALENYKLWIVTIEHALWGTKAVLSFNLCLTGIISSLCQSFFVKRAWKMHNHSKWILYPLSIFLVTILAGCLFAGINAMIMTKGMDPLTGVPAGGRKQYYVIALIAYTYWMVGALTLDVILATITIVALWKSKTGEMTSDRVILKVISLTSESAVLPAICMLIAVSLFFGMPSKSDNIVILMLLLSGKFYAYGLLRTLNSRQNLRDRMDSRELGRVSLSEWTWSVEVTSQTHRGIDKPPIAQADGSRRGSEASTSTSRTLVADSECPSFASGLDLSRSRSPVSPHSTPVLDAQECGHRTGTVKDML